MSLLQRIRPLFASLFLFLALSCSKKTSKAIIVGVFFQESAEGKNESTALLVLARAPENMALKDADITLTAKFTPQGATEEKTFTKTTHVTKIIRNKIDEVLFTMEKAVPLGTKVKINGAERTVQAYDKKLIDDLKGKKEEKEKDED